MHVEGSFPCGLRLPFFGKPMGLPLGLPALLFLLLADSPLVILIEACQKPVLRYLWTGD